MYSCHSRPQSGFILMLLVVVMAVGAVAFFSLYHDNASLRYQSDVYLKQMSQLNEVKQQLLKYAVFQPELYQSDLVSNSRTYKEAGKLPGPGYLPCRDLDGDGWVLGAETSCGNPRDTADDTSGFVYGFLPVGFKTRNFYFGALEPRQFYYVVDERFVNGNNLYNNGSTGRYAPLNITLSPAMGPDAPPPNGLPDGTLPWLTLNGVEGYVALIIFPNVPQVFQDGFAQDRSQSGTAIERIADYLDQRFDVNGHQVDGNADGNRHFFSQSRENIGVNDLVVGITFSEWQNAVMNRVCSQLDSLTQVDSNAAYWFNDYDAVQNPSGGNWRSFTGACGL
ncbi:MAG: hypothetical protein DSZ27_01845 [Thiomicrospira sp.]|nr:MAG: hypothetical protein DSZ27_01845 [Thiomicrospira sp.]